MQKLTKKQKQYQREYKKLIKKLDLYGQSPSKSHKDITKKVIDRLSRREATVREYTKIYNRYLRSVYNFNERYKQNVKIPTPHDRIDAGTLKTLIKRYEEWKRERRRFVRKIPREDMAIFYQAIHFIEEIKYIFAMSHQTGYTQAVRYNCDELINYLRNLLPSKNFERNKALRRMRLLWEMLCDAMEKYVYAYKDPDKQEEAINKIAWIITGEGDFANTNIVTDTGDMIYE